MRHLFPCFGVPRHCSNVLSWLAIIAITCVIFAPRSHAFNELTAAQTLIYDRSHLANTSAGQQITYAYRGWNTESMPVSDTVVMNIIAEHDDDKRDVSLEFLTAERKMPLPDFKAFRGNPVVIGMLEHMAQSLGEETGGGVLYFRNRIRDALAGEDVKIIDNTRQSYKDGDVPVTRIEMTPFKSDPYLAERPALLQSLWWIDLSNEVPGGLLGMGYDRPDGDSRTTHISLSIQTGE